MRRVLSILVACISLVFCPQVVFATEVVINEYFPNPEGSAESGEWIELYNLTDSPVSIAGWMIDDIAEGGSSAYTIPAETTIAAKSYFIIERVTSGIILNNDSDTIRLLRGTEEEDSHRYSSTDENVSYGRKIDAGTEWVTFSAATKNESNNAGTIVPTLTPTVVPSVPPTKTPAPTKTPTPTKIESPTNTPVPTVKKSTSPTKKLSAPTKKIPPTSRQATKVPEKDVLSEKTREEELPTPTPEVKVLSSMTDNLGFVFILTGGVLLTGCGGLAFYTYRKNRDLQN